MQVFTGTFAEIAKTKQAAMDNRYRLNPERFVRGRPRVKLPPTEVAINPISDEEIADGVLDAVNVSVHDIRLAF
ncbi:hypothetical protein ACUNV4_30235 [Granulosicoccus sp. 3-233]|uniref:hypothetical protein n=1 Tax=Granulosicoccus sp. 3-233 TaxID=3417969 RepID=UPI003D359178